jgi:hypothetical protein
VAGDDLAAAGWRRDEAFDESVRLSSAFLPSHFWDHTVYARTSADGTEWYLGGASRTSDKSENPLNEWHLYVLTGLPSEVPALHVASERPGGRLKDLLGFRDRRTGDKAFDKAFTVEGDEGLAQRLLTVDTRTLLTQRMTKTTMVELGGSVLRVSDRIHRNWAVVEPTIDQVDADRRDSLVAFAQQVHAFVVAGLGGR